jgi:mono/diheme cytochrome c family protein
MSVVSRTRRLAAGSLLLGATLLLTGCPGDLGGFERITDRRREYLPPPAHPQPPPVSPGALSALAGAEPAGLAMVDLPPGVTEAMVMEGQRLYPTPCAACHGPGGTGTPAGPALTDQDWINIDGSFESLVQVIQVGVLAPRQYPGAMPPLGGGNFDEEQVRQIAAYLYVLSRQGGG